LGRRLLGAITHSSNEPGELSQWLCHDDRTINIVLGYYYPPFARAKGEVFVLLYVCFFVCSVNDFSTTRGPIHAKVRMRAYLFPDVSSPLLGVGGPRRAEKGANENFVTMGVNGEFLHFGGF